MDIDDDSKTTEAILLQSNIQNIQINTPYTVRRKKFLGLGMVFSKEFRIEVRGQEGRDRVRLEQMENYGWDAYSADDKHPCIKVRLERFRHRLQEIREDLPKHVNREDLHTLSSCIL